MTFREVETPEQLMLFLDQNIEYGVIDKEGKRYCDSNSCEFQNVCNQEWQLRSVDKILEDGVGHCYDQVEIEREWFEQRGIEVKTFWISAYQEEIENSGFSHTYLLYKEGRVWKLFEHSDFFNRGIYAFDSIRKAVKWQATNQIRFAESCIQPLNKYVTCIKEFKKPPIGVNMEEYLQFIDKSRDYVL